MRSARGQCSGVVVVGWYPTVGLRIVNFVRTFGKAWGISYFVVGCGLTHGRNLTLVMIVRRGGMFAACFVRHTDLIDLSPLCVAINWFETLNLASPTEQEPKMLC